MWGSRKRYRSRPADLKRQVSLQNVDGKGWRYREEVPGEHPQSWALAAGQGNGGTSTLSYTSFCSFTWCYFLLFGGGVGDCVFYD